VIDDDDDDSASPEPCSAEAVVQPATSCTPVAATVLSVSGIDLNCPMGDYLFTNASEWNSYLNSCNAPPFVDPLASFDWANNNVIASLETVGGCNADSGFHWVEECDGAVHFGDWIEGCGECAAIFAASNWVSVPTTVTAVTFDECVPGDSCAP